MNIKLKISLFTLLLGAMASSQAGAALIYGIDAVAGADFNVVTGTGVSIADPDTTTTWISGPSSGKNTAGQISVTGLTGLSNTGSDDITVRVDLDGTHDVTFDKFAFAMQRGGNGAAGANTISNAEYSVDGTNFIGVSVMEVAVGANNGSNNVGPADTITNFRAPNGLGGTIGPQQVYVVDGLSAAGTLNSGSFYVRFNLGATNNTAASAVFLTDRNDLTTTAMALAANNATDLGADDGYDMAWFGTSVLIPEPSSLALFGLGALGLLTLRKRS